MPESERPKKLQKLMHNDASNGFNGASHIDNEADLKLPSSTSIPILPRDGKVLLLDIEGCTTAISFVKDGLFPFALSHLEKYLDGLEGGLESLSPVLESLEADMKQLDASHASVKELALDKEKNDDGDNDKEKETKRQIALHVKALMAHDVKASGLKSLQGKIWKSGYASGELKGHVYQDFKPLLTWCKSQDISVNIYSSGSIAAQKLLFGNSEEGDLCSFFDNHFDITTSGSKKEAGSYKKIAESLGVDVRDICFVSDAEAELVAAREAGVGLIVMSVRPGNVPLTDVGKNFPIIYSLLQICGSGK